MADTSTSTSGTAASGEQIHYRGCNLCEAMCGLEIRHDGEQILSIRGDAQDPLSRGHICPKAVALQDIQNDPDRLRRPVKRLPDGSFEEISWDEAFDLTVAGLQGLQDRHGRDSLAVYLGNPNVHNYGSLLFGPPLLRSLRTRYRYSATSVDQLPHHMASYFMFGHDFLLPIPDVDHTDFFLIMGANPAVSNGSIMSAPDIKKRIKAVRERGGKVVVVDPRRTETAALADDLHRVLPGSDVYLLAAMLRLVFENGLDPNRHLADDGEGEDALRRAVEPFTVELAAQKTGLDTDTIRKLTRELIAAPSAVVYGRMGLSTQEHGALCQWLIYALNWATGNLDRRGGSMIPLPAADIVASRRGGSFGRWTSRVRKLPEFSGELPVVTLAEDMEAAAEDGEGPRGLLTVAGNPVLSTPDGRRLEKTLENLEFMVSVDIYINETTRHANVILPTTAPLEHDHYDLAFHALAIRDTARYSPALFDPPADAKHDWQIFSELLRRLAPKAPLGAKAGRWTMAKLGPAGVLDMLLRSGPHGAGRLGLGKGLTLKRLKKSVHGVDLGPLKPVLKERIRTADGRIQLAPKLFIEGLAEVATDLESAGEQNGDGLLLIGRRHVRSGNSWMHNYARLMRGKPRCTLLVHPDDAASRGLTDGEKATVRSAVGSVEALVEVSDEIRPGVVSLPHGWGHHRPGIRLTVAAEQPGTSVNDLTDPSFIDAVSGNAALSGVPVTVQAL